MSVEKHHLNEDTDSSVPNFNLVFPREVISNILSYLPWKEVKNCRVVCQLWKEVVDNDVCYEKLRRQVNSIFKSCFTSRPTEEFYRLDIPFYLYYAIGKRAFGQNLLKNTFGENQLLPHAGDNAEGAPVFQEHNLMHNNEDEGLEVEQLPDDAEEMVELQNEEERERNDNDDASSDMSDDDMPIENIHRDGNHDPEQQNEEDHGSESEDESQASNSSQGEASNSSQGEASNSFQEYAEVDEIGNDLFWPFFNTGRHNFGNYPSYFKAKFKHWVVKSNGGEGWIVEDPPAGSDPLPAELGQTSCFATSYGVCCKYQMVTLSDYGLTPKIMDEVQPHIEVSEWYAGRFDCGCIYKMRVMLMDSEKRSIVNISNIKEVRQWQGRQWHKVSNTFKDYGPGVRYILFIHAGQDTKFWAGHYGSKMAGASVIARIPDTFPANSGHGSCSYQGSCSDEDIECI